MKHFRFTILVIVLLLFIPLFMVGELSRADKPGNKHIRVQQEKQHSQKKELLYIEFPTPWPFN